MAAALVGCFVGACAGGSPTDAMVSTPTVEDAARPAFDIRSCEASAVRLTAPLMLIDATLGAPVRLSGGRFVYRCGHRGGRGWVMFPREGERVDCLRRAGNDCPHGWTDRQPSVESVG